MTWSYSSGMRADYNRQEISTSGPIINNDTYFTHLGQR